MTMYTVYAVCPRPHRATNGTHEPLVWNVEADDAPHAEQLARAEHGQRLLISAVVEGERPDAVEAYPADIGPGCEEWPTAQGIGLRSDPERPPAIGEYIYVPYHEGGHFTAPDELPGLARVTNVIPSTGPGKTSYMVAVAEHRGGQTSWSYLASHQREWHERYRYMRAGMSR